ncbi:hypothetical protein BCR41DRAFT_397469 [Lobosporangium transversale]|uniref:Secreted protein n=1 Tax=Lobosporangium transversale TaxID=64571 RepID=A0A1Y2GKM0_9FUNG|nr:hypothetical protein BCR41DRAFT_397469 [Lobosporangium transversale]ORZ12453.1 hypothetical protein BCR41DRAFT_397469 [Lobosporangium transversale]|eukprot:XP_021880072.1 hypothetical protein BCR41DRAFT_397469 [Lobosporangium transversale]
MERWILTFVASIKVFLFVPHHPVASATSLPSGSRRLPKGLLFSWISENFLRVGACLWDGGHWPAEAHLEHDTEDY